MNKKKKGWLITLAVLALILLALVLGGFMVVKSYLDQIDRTYNEQVDVIAPEDEFFEEDEGDVIGGGEEPPPEENPPEDPNTINIDPASVEWSFIERIEDDRLINLLLIGKDKYPTDTTKARRRSDSMILCSINPETGEVSMISFLRDLYVQIPNGYSDNRLNAAYTFGGHELLDEALTLNFGVSVDANFEVDMAGFEQIIDMVGGVEVELTKAEANHLSKLMNTEIQPGTAHLSGRAARVFAQIRKLDSDFGRTNRQREILMAVFRKVKDLPVNELLALMHEALAYMSTDLTDTEILSLAYRLLPMVPSLEIETYAVPAKGCYQNAKIRGMAVLLPDREKIRQLLEEEYLPLD